MSNKGKKNVKCPHCGHYFDADFFTVVRGDLDLDLKEMIINGEFDLLLCPQCSKLFPYEDTFIYIDAKAEILAFVMPKDSRGKNELIEKMEADYKLIKNSCAGNALFSMKPFYFFGADELAQLLLNDRDTEEEGEVMEFIAGEAGYKTVNLSPSFSRNRNILFSLPFKGDCVSLETVLFGCSEILKINDRLKRLENACKELKKLTEEDFKKTIR